MSTGQLNGVIRRIHKLAGLHELATCSDGQLMERFVKDQDEHAFELLLERHGPMVLGVCRRVLHQTQDAEDAFQATFLVFMRKASSIRSRETVGNWLYGVAFRTSIKAKVAASKRTFKERQGNPMKWHAPAEGEIWQDIQPVLDEELERLPDKYRTLIVLCDLEGKPRKEVAEKLKLADGTLSSRLATARKLLAQRLTKRGITLSAGALAAVLTQNLASATVPTALSASTIQAVHVLAAGGAAAGVISSNVAALSEGVLKAMFLTLSGQKRGYVGKDDVFLLTYGDGVADVDIAKVVEFHRSHGKKATLTTVRPTSRFGIIGIGGAGTVEHFNEKPVLDTWINAGFFVFNRSVFEYLEGGDECVLEGKPLESLAADGHLMAYRHEGFFYAMDTYRDYQYLNELWISGMPPWKVWD